MSGEKGGSMEKRNKRETKKRNTKETGRDRRVKASANVQSRQPKQAVTPLRVTSGPVKRTCFDCVFCISDMVLWLGTLVTGFPIGGQCANHPDTPGQVRPIPRTPCRNFRGKPLRLDPPQPPNDKIRYIPLTRGLFAIVDAEDYEWLSQYKWCAQFSEYTRTYYAVRKCRGHTVFMHRMIMNPPGGKVVDHMNGNGLDNRRCNLRICSPKENSCNKPKRRNTKSRFIGVYRRRNKYQVILKHNGKAYGGGMFDDEVEAAKARDRLAIQLHGKYARLNFPPENPEGEGE
jgi:hypothetical protein